MNEVNDHDDDRSHNEATDDEKRCYDGKEMTIVTDEATIDQRATSNNNACSNDNPSNHNDANNKSVD